ncbi:MAG: Holliday junction resolvase RuvX [Planctomycetota bacterium]|jgi:putative Holliday junction resolvase|nr:Holliday junction resolvase RuvX [Planctomycetota bacterium]
MRLLGVDLGDRRVGFAVTDEAELLAVPSGFAAVRTLAEALEAVLAKAEAEGAELVVVGNPLNMDGRPGPKSREAVEFGDMVRRAGRDAVMWDERLTTSEATRLLREAGHSRKRRKTLIDANSAQRLLESYLGFRRRGGARTDV